MNSDLSKTQTRSSSKLNVLIIFLLSFIISTIYASENLDFDIEKKTCYLAKRIVVHALQAPRLLEHAIKNYATNCERSDCLCYRINLYCILGDIIAISEKSIDNSGGWSASMVVVLASASVPIKTAFRFAMTVWLN